LNFGNLSNFALGLKFAPKIIYAPNDNMGIDGMIINITTVLAGAVTNPFNSGYFQGDKGATLEAVSACPGMYGTGSYSGFPGNLLVDKTTGASDNGNGVNGRKFLLPAIWDPSTCAWYGMGLYSGFPGNLLVDKTTGASYHWNGVNGRKFLLPAIWDPSTCTCKTLV